MTQPTDFDLNAFQAAVEQELERLQRRAGSEARSAELPWQVVMGDDPQGRELAATAQQAEELVKRKDIRARLCPALTTASDDAFEIAKIITPILVPLGLAGTIALPLTPLFIAAGALVIARIGISALCADYPKKDQEKK
jgi:hypothetical protein